MPLAAVDDLHADVAAEIVPDQDFSSGRVADVREERRVEPVTVGRSVKPPRLSGSITGALDATQLPAPVDVPRLVDDVGQDHVAHGRGAENDAHTGL